MSRFETLPMAVILQIRITMNVKPNILFIPLFLISFLGLGMTKFATLAQASTSLSCSTIFSDESPYLTLSKIIADSSLFQDHVNQSWPQKPDVYVLHDLVKLSAQLSDADRANLIEQNRSNSRDGHKQKIIAKALFDPDAWDLWLGNIGRNGSNREELYSYRELLLNLNPEQKSNLKKIISENYAESVENKGYRDYALPSKRAVEAVLRFLMDSDRYFEFNAKREGVLRAYQRLARENQSIVQNGGFGNYSFSQMLQTFKLFQNYLEVIPDSGAKVYIQGSFVTQRAKIDSSDLDIFFEGTNNYRFQRLVKIATGRTIQQDLQNIFSDHENVDLHIEDGASKYIEKKKEVIQSLSGEVGGIIIEISATGMRLLYFPSATIEYVNPAYPAAKLAPTPQIYTLDL